ncbi:hypothetical protein MesoLj113a_64890 [Mesorhizobium sp. 113-1-2]|nr:Short chain dehydrogenase [Mesorhizobium loti]BCG75331.1 hypothetical protein MesoLj113a_64890 [Mesorhizobium sp. 113-1-2]
MPASTRTNKSNAKEKQQRIQRQVDSDDPGQTEIETGWRHAGRRAKIGFGGLKALSSVQHEQAGRPP